MNVVSKSIIGAIAAGVAMVSGAAYATPKLPCDTAQLIVPWKPGGGTQVLAMWRRMLLWLPGSDTDPVTMATGLLKHLGISWGQ